MGKKIGKLFICIMLVTSTLVIFPGENVKATGNTYYVSTSGSDSNSGTLSSPWRTIQKAANTVSSGDTVLVRGGTYSERVTLTKSGTSSAWITFKNYQGETPVIDGSGITISGYDSGLFDISSTSYIILDGFTVRDSTKAGISVHRSHHVTIKNCHTLYTYSSGIRSDNKDSYSEPTPNNIIIDSNWIQYSHQGGGQEAMSICRTADFQITNNLVDDTNHYIGIDCKQSCYNGVIANNEVYTTSSGNIYVDAHSTYPSYNIDIYNNYIHGSGSASIGIKVGSEDGGANVYDINIYNNIVVTGSYCYKYADVETSPYRQTLNNIKFINNVFITTGGVACLRLYVTPAGYNNYYTNMVIRNNIFKGGEAISLNNQPTSQLTVDHNFFCTGTKSDVYGTNYLTGDPKFVSSTDYHLQSTSSAIGFGINTDDLSIDFDSNPVTQSTTIDIGADEYNSSTVDSNSNPVTKDTTIDIGADEYNSNGTATTDCKNNPPNKPTINGKINGKTSTDYEYKYVSTDPDGDNIIYRINWGDETEEVWIGPYTPGEEASFIHKWSEKGDYIIKVKAIDANSAESNWATFEVSIHHTRIYHPIKELFLKIVKSFSII